MDNQKAIESYRKRLLRKPGNTDNILVESNGSRENDDHSFLDGHADSKLSTSIQALDILANENEENEKEILDMSQKLSIHGAGLLKALDSGNVKYFEEYPKSFALLEVLVRTDGSRPSYLIKQGKIDFSSGASTEWEGILTPDIDRIQDALACIGRVELTGIHIGTGFLIADNLIATNRHVLQAIASRQRDGSWAFKAGAGIDFGREFRGIDSLRPRQLTSVVYAGDEIKTSIDHNSLDLALIALNECEEDGLPKKNLGIESATDWASEGKYIITAGYPGNPGLGGLTNYGTNVLNLLFKSTYGFKRLAPGQVILGEETAAPGQFSHDASTLGGNSGSPVVLLGTESIAAGIHYGGRLSFPRENWGHILAHYFDRKDSITNKSLRNCLEEYEVEIGASI
ncbi:MAG: hypothetical protein EOO88_11540 [Pedobacter sp.]|nr:MAG: hypothetical protein EOO88_11540 [Pedobacter sp.]